MSLTKTAVTYGSNGKLISGKYGIIDFGKLITAEKNTNGQSN